MLKPNYAVKALIPYPIIDYETASENSFFRKADLAITQCYKIRRRIYNFLLMSFCVFSALGLFYYLYAADGLMPVSMYIPIKKAVEVNISVLYEIRKLHLFASLFLFFSGFTVFGSPISLLFIASNAFLIGFSLKYSYSFLSRITSTGYVLLYFLCISLFALLDLLFCCEVIRFSRYARGGTAEMMNFRRMAGYICTFAAIIIFDIFVTYIFALISR